MSRTPEDVDATLIDFGRQLTQVMMSVSTLSSKFKLLQSAVRGIAQAPEEKPVQVKKTDEKSVDSIDTSLFDSGTATRPEPQPKKSLKHFIVLHRVPIGESPVPKDWAKMRLLPIGKNTTSLDMGTIFFVGAVMHESVNASKQKSAQTNTPQEKVFVYTVRVPEDDIVKAKPITATPGVALDSTRPTSSVTINSYMIHPQRAKECKVTLDLMYELREFVEKYKMEIRRLIPQYMRTVTMSDIQRGGSHERAECQSVMGGLMRFALQK